MTMEQPVTRTIGNEPDRHCLTRLQKLRVCLSDLGRRERPLRGLSAFALQVEVEPVEMHRMRRCAAVDAPPRNGVAFIEGETLRVRPRLAVEHQDLAGV